jgi:hypothetical protein
VKPKLDRYIIKKLGGIDTIRHNYADWLIDKKNSDALNYKIKIISVGNPTRSNHRVITENLPAVFYQETNIVFTTNFKTLAEAINNNIDSFFSVTNFGRRSSKGYGSFTLQETNLNSFKESLKLYSNNNLYGHYNRNKLSWEELIKTEWGRLKSGKNRPYEKSRIFKYASRERRRWEKRWMKLGILDEIDIDPTLPGLLFNHEPLDCSNDENNDTYNGVEDNPELETEEENDYYYCFYRAMLGLPELYEFRAENDQIYQFKISNETIGRFKSPVTFKVFEGKVFAFPEYFNPDILNQSFQLDLILKTNAGNIVRAFDCSDGRFDISTPSDFDLLKFLNSYFATVGFTKINN